MHKAIKRFGLEGVLDDDSSFARLRDYYESQIVRDMREDGYVPVLDLGTYWSTDFTGTNYNFKLSVYGVKVGRKKAWEVEGFAGGREVPRHTPPTKSKQSSTPSE